MLIIYLGRPQGGYTEIFMWIPFYWKCVKKGGSKREILGGGWWFMAWNLEVRVILDVMDDLVFQRKIPWNFCIIFMRCGPGMGVQEGRYLGGHWGFLIQDLVDMKGSSLISWMFFTLRKIPWNLCVDLYFKYVRNGRLRMWVLFEDVEFLNLET